MSVVIPVKNDAAPLATCLAALSVQSLPPMEIIVVDNGSIDDTARTASAAGVTCITELKPGVPAASSARYDHARGDIIARLDAESVPPT